MASPVSIGDALMMAKLAFKLGRAFTTGRKSAPSEFREVESQLYSISTALSSFATTCQDATLNLSRNDLKLPSRTKPGQADGKDALDSMIKACAETLTHLEKVVNKYSSIAQPADASRPAVIRWSSELVKNWKKVLWTTEGGDLSTLRSHLTVHINCLNLVLGVINQTQGARVEMQVDGVAVMLKEIHTWFIDNLAGQSQSAPSTQQVEMPTPLEPSLINIEFELCADPSSGGQILCPRASLTPKWDKQTVTTELSGEAKEPKRLFRCRCWSQQPQPAPHEATLSGFSLSPLSSVLRLASTKKAYMLFKAPSRAANRLTSLVIKNVPAAMMQEFEKSFVDLISLRNASFLLQKNMGTMLAYHTTPSESSSDDGETRLLNMMADLSTSQAKVGKITFSLGRQAYVRDSVDVVQLLHYKVLQKEFLIGDLAIQADDLKPMATAELIVFYAPSQDDPEPDISRAIIHLTHRTTIKCIQSSCEVKLEAVGCAGLSPSDQEQILRGVGVTLQLTSPQATMDLKEKLSQMKQELFVISLKTPRADENVALTLSVGGVHTETVDLPDSEISILQSESTGQLRLVVASKDGATILSQELAKDILDSTAGTKPKFTSPTWVVQMGADGSREIQRYKDGFQFFDFSNVQMDRLFGLGLAAIAGGPPGQAQIKG